MTRNEILNKYIEQKQKSGSDIVEHLETLYQYALRCNHVTEFGVRYVQSTWAFMAASVDNGCTVVSYDFDYNDEVKSAEEILGFKWKFIYADTTQIDISTTDMLFIDTCHEYVQVKQELEKHSDKVTKYIFFHDIITYGNIGERGGEGIMKAVNEFLVSHREWEVCHYAAYNNGLMGIRRK